MKTFTSHRTYLNTAMRRLRMRILMKSMWKAKRMWVTVASVTWSDELVLEEMIPIIWNTFPLLFSECDCPTIKKNHFVLNNWIQEPVGSIEKSIGEISSSEFKARIHSERTWNNTIGRNAHEYDVHERGKITDLNWKYRLTSKRVYHSHYHISHHK
jgi:hypothetical protein